VSILSLMLRDISVLYDAKNMTRIIFTRE